MSVLVNALGRPEPSSEIQRRLAAVHPRLSLRFIDTFDAHWAICMRWDENDPRWQQVQSQEVDPNRSMDIVGYLPMTCSVAEAPAYLERALRQFPREDIQRVADHVMAFNQTTPLQAAVKEAMADVLDMADPSGKARRGRRTRVTPSAS